MEKESTNLQEYQLKDSTVVGQNFYSYGKLKYLSGKQVCEMGVYLNPGNDKFYKAINSEIYVDKTELIQYTNRVFNTMQQNVCVSRPRRFGKSMTANMLAAYYSRGCQSEKLFDGLKIKEDSSFSKYLNKHNVFFINMQEFLSRSKTVEKMVLRLNRILMRDLKQEYPDVDYFDEEDLAESMQDVYQQTGCPFVIIIDEWDCIFREYKSDKEAQEQYLDFLRDFLKDKSYIHLAYMTGILPVKKYGTHSALNMFDEFSMIYAGPLAKFVGFTETEVRELCEKYHMDMREIREWYDGYRFENCEPVYNPRSVVNGMLFGSIRNYWNMTESFEALQTYIDMNFEGLKDNILSMLAGEHIPVNTGNFTNDMTTFRDENDVLTLLIHLGYLGYDQDTHSAFVPNEEIRQELAKAVKRKKWNEFLTFQQESSELLDATLDMDADTVARSIEKIHNEYASAIQYNNENSLSSILSIGYLSTMRYYFKPIREFPAGRGFADFVYLPKPEYSRDYPALVVELKWNQNAQTAIRQIKNRQYPEAVTNYTDNILLVGISYDKKQKTHNCVIEKYSEK